MTSRRQRLRAVWACALLAVLLLAGLAAWLVHTVSIDQRLRAVGQATVLPPAAPPAQAAALATAPAAPPVAPPAASLAPDETLVDPAGLAVAAVAATAVTRRGDSAAAGAAQKAAGDEPARKVSKVNKVRKKLSTAGQAGAARDRTFVRCPQLGKPGAVMCRWHICNGGAGKEAACRPYLERRP